MWILHPSYYNDTIHNTLQQLPYPEYTQDLFLSVTEGLMPLLLTLAFLYSASSIVKVQYDSCRVNANFILAYAPWSFASCFVWEVLRPSPVPFAYAVCIASTILWTGRFSFELYAEICVNTTAVEQSRSSVNHCTYFTDNNDSFQELVNEKHERLKESMKMMGLANWVHWLAWFTKNFIFLLISVIIITGVLKVQYSTVCSILLTLVIFTSSIKFYANYVSQQESVLRTDISKNSSRWLLLWCWE